MSISDKQIEKARDRARKAGVKSHTRARHRRAERAAAKAAQYQRTGFDPEIAKTSGSFNLRLGRRLAQIARGQ